MTAPVNPVSLATVRAYHERTKHHLHRYARSLGFLDWACQPDPFRRYPGAPELLLALDPALGAEPSFGDVLAGRAPAVAVGPESVSRLLFDSLALSAWKEAGPSRWALRVNPSSGNLHPTEGWLIGRVPGLLDAPSVCHYAPSRHALEVRATLPEELWQALTARLPDGALLVGLSSIHWREAWKYGERAYRYCQHDVGHAIGAVALAAGALGWRARVVLAALDEEVAALLGLGEPAEPEAEHPDCLIAVWPKTDEPGFSFDDEDFHIDPGTLDALRALPWAGSPSALSQDHHPWPVIDEVAAAARKTGRAPAELVPPLSVLAEPPEVPARRIIRQRRSAVAMDASSPIDRDAFFGMMGRLLPGRAPFDALPLAPRVHLLVLVHRVTGLPSGLYVLVRDGDAEGLRSRMDPTFDWTAPAGAQAAPGLFLLAEGDARSAARSVNCGQDIAADGAFAVEMVAELDSALSALGPFGYRAVHWEAGLIGQALYLEAEALGLRGTGIGCFFDDAVHEIMGRRDPGLAMVYGFTTGGPVDDARLRTAPPYETR